LLPARTRPFGNMQAELHTKSEAKLSDLRPPRPGWASCPLLPQKAGSFLLSSGLLPLRRFSVAAEGILRCNYRPARAPRLDPSTLLQPAMISLPTFDSLDP